MATTPFQVTTVYLWDNGMLMVFDQFGQQMPEYQGPVEKCGDRLAHVFPRERWIHGQWNITHRAV